MLPLSVGMEASVDAPVYERHRPEKTLLYQLVEQHYPAFEPLCSFLQIPFLWRRIM